MSERTAKEILILSRVNVDRVRVPHTSLPPLSDFIVPRERMKINELI